MRKRPRSTGRDGNPPDIRALEMMLDYAIIEGAELRLPLFVLLLRTARLELMTGIEAFGGLRECRVETKINDCLGEGADQFLAQPAQQACRIDGAGDISQNSTLMTQDR
jgi:hypothetical protein